MACSQRFVGGLGLDDGEREIPRVAQQVIDPLRRLADKTLAHRHDAAVRDRALLGDRMRLVIPAGGEKLRHDQLAAGIGLGCGAFHEVLPRCSGAIAQTFAATRRTPCFQDPYVLPR
jgi:hypothetical protein